MSLNNYINKLINKVCHRNKKRHYECMICGQIIAPFVSGGKDINDRTLFDDYGWDRLKNYKWWICHHCMCHSHDKSWDEWQEMVECNNNKILALIKKKDPEYYDYWFDGGRERELFGRYARWDLN